MENSEIVAVENKHQGFFKNLSEKWNSLSPEKRVYFTQLGLVAAMQAADTLTTHVGIQHVGGKELNPSAQYLLDSGGIMALLMVKMVFAAFQIVGNEIVRKVALKGEPVNIVNNILRLENLCYAALCISNAAQIMLAK